MALHHQHLKRCLTAIKAVDERLHVIESQDMTQLEPNPTNIRLVTYNVLADCYVRHHLRNEEKRKHYFGDIPEEHLQWSHRWPCIQQEVRRLKGDIVCMQEVEFAKFDDEFCPFMQSLGYDRCIMQNDTNREPDHPVGVAIFLRSARFEVTKEHHRSRALILGLQDRVTSTSLALANCHLIAQASREADRLRQAESVMRLVERLNADATVVLGDFNDEEHTRCVRYVLQQTLALRAGAPHAQALEAQGQSVFASTSSSGGPEGEAPAEEESDAEGDATEATEASAAADEVVASLDGHRLLMYSAYENVDLFTFVARYLVSRMDHVLLSSNCELVARHAPFAPETRDAVLAHLLPSAQHGSDHLPVAVEVRIDREVVCRAATPETDRVDPALYMTSELVAEWQQLLRQAPPRPKGGKPTGAELARLKAFAEDKRQLLATLPESARPLLKRVTLETDPATVVKSS
ncbi:uncharacterized protein MONBRDRAFT_34194 [Monosiga brevicollis MX1]|uniref:Endonuclease/exonuclease/phosphatase domain-containing protein n=1 Tax=Monosiga brevicollis TaxID=81824 RepID=A9VA55_MONBE|nr:uncharacterized protein MONBRDRAFT_34194 [Monosiga brevicollis MX1]EDQ85606.1 predicted protein [Monosiga brevicollis MX1]|eukprot:XP_001749555.1 hypothetical protein [Monosiga brevicollis MX1]